MKLTKKEASIALQLLADRGWSNFMEKLLAKEVPPNDLQEWVVKKGLIPRDRKLFVKLLKWQAKKAS